jgi:hypothetical protein
MVVAAVSRSIAASAEIIRRFMGNLRPVRQRKICASAFGLGRTATQPCERPHTSPLCVLPRSGLLNELGCCCRRQGLNCARRVFP